MSYTSQVKIIVSFRFNQEVTPEVYDELELFVQMARLNPDNEQIYLMEDIDQPDYFTLVETWKNIETVNAHTQQQYFKDFVAFLAIHTAFIQVRKLKHLVVRGDNIPGERLS